jgi:hypothetical protein
MPCKIAGIDVHKKMLAVVVSDVEIESEYRFERRMFSSNPEQLRSMAAWLVEQEAEEVVMESTAQYWKPVWEALVRLSSTMLVGHRKWTSIPDLLPFSEVRQDSCSDARCLMAF